MGGLFGKKAQSTTPTRLNGITVNQSIYGNTVPLLYGTSRLPIMLIDYVDFLAKAQSQSSGGKGGGGGSTSSYTYSASIVGLLCEGPINGVPAVFSDSTQTTLAKLNLTLFKGTANQAPWSYMTSKHPDHALPYDHMAHVDGANFDLGGQAGLPNLSFEVQGLALYNGGPDAEPATIIKDYCTDPNHGVNFPYLADLTGTNSYQAYCIAMGFLISPQETTQRQAQDFLREILQLTNSNAVFTAGLGLRIVPYGDQAIGVSWTPDLTPQYRFGDADYLYEDGQQPVIETPIPSNQTFNIFTVEYLNRANQYNIDTETFRDEQDIAINGERPAPTVTLHSITRASVALTVATLLCLRNLYVRSTYTFKVRFDFSRLEPMDYVAIDDSSSGIVDKLVRITKVEDAVDDDLGEVLTLTAEEVLVGPASAPIYDTELAQGFAANYGADPGNVATPYIFTAPPALTTSGYEEWIAVCGQTGLWGWADVYASLDNVTYDHVGIKGNPSRYGTLVNPLPSGADPDATNQLTVAFSGSIPVELDSATRAAADGLRNLCIVDGEVISYQNVTPMGNNTFRLSYLRRGNYGSSIAAHAAGSFFAVLDNAIFRMPFDPGLSGQPVWFKFVGVNYYGGGAQDISGVPAYLAFFQGQNHGQLLAPGATPLIARGDCVNVGSQIFKKTTAVEGWDSDCISVDAFSGGCTVRCRPVQTNRGLMVGLNSDPQTDQSYVSIDHAWYISADGTAYIYESGVLIQPTRAYTTNDIFEIRYDGKFATYFINGVQWRTVADPGKAFFFDSSFSTPGAAIDNVYFGALNPANSSPFIARGQCKVSDESFTKVGGATAWDSDIYSLEGYPAAHISFKANQTNADFIIGFSISPGLDQSFASVNAGFDCVAGGTIRAVLGAGANIVTGATYTTSDLLALTYDGITVTWLKNGVSIYSSTLAASVGSALAPPNTPVFLDSSFFTPGAGANTVQFGPTTQFQLADTAQLGNNASGTVVSLTTNGVGSGSILKSSGTSFVDLPVGSTVTAEGYPFGVDIQVDLQFRAFSGNTTMGLSAYTLQIYRTVGGGGATAVGAPFDLHAVLVTEPIIIVGGTNAWSGHQLATLSAVDVPPNGLVQYEIRLSWTTDAGSAGTVSGDYFAAAGATKIREYKR